MNFSILLKVFILLVCSDIYAFNGDFVSNVGETPNRVLNFYANLS